MGFDKAKYVHTLACNVNVTVHIPENVLRAFFRFFTISIDKIKILKKSFGEKHVY